MVRATSVFSQVLNQVPRSLFEEIVGKHRGDYRAKGFRCWDQLVCMLFAQLAQAKSLREITIGLQSCAGKLQHLGVFCYPKRSTLAYANEHRPSEIYEELFHRLASKLRVSNLRGPDRKPFRFRGKLYSLDSTLIELSVSMFDWAKYVKTKGAVKIHLMLDHDGCLPKFAVVTDGRVHDVRVAQNLSFAPGTVVAVDKGYVDYELYSRWTEEQVSFVTRPKKNMRYRVLEEREVPGGNIVSDQIIELASSYAAERCTVPLRLVQAVDPKTGEFRECLTNNLKLSPRTIVGVYRERWRIETFFRTLKQNLRVKTFVGTSANAVQIQIWTALIAMLLLKYLKHLSTWNWSLSNLIALLRWNLFGYRDLWEWLNNPGVPPPDTPLSQPYLSGLGLQGGT